VKAISLERDVILQLKCLAAGLFRPDILNPGAIDDDLPLIGGSLCRDSVDALELAICIEEEFGIAIRSEGYSQGVFKNFASLADFLCAQAPARVARRSVPAEVQASTSRSAGRVRSAHFRVTPSCQSTTPLKMARSQPA